MNEWNSVRILPEPGKEVLLELMDEKEIIGFYNPQINMFITETDEYPVSYVTAWKEIE